MPLALGSPFPDLALPDIEGQTTPLARAWSAGPALILIGHRNCKTTRQTLPYVERIHRRRATHATALAILQDEPDDARALAAQLELSLPLRLEGDPYPLSTALAVNVVPTLFLVERDGRVGATCEAFRKAELQDFASRLGVAGALFEDDDPMPAMKPG
jgi:peroxiredoxin